MIIAGIPIEAWIQGIATFIIIYLTGYITTKIIEKWQQTKKKQNQKKQT